MNHRNEEFPSTDFINFFSLFYQEWNQSLVRADSKQSSPRISAWTLRWMGFNGWVYSKTEILLFFTHSHFSNSDLFWPILTKIQCLNGINSAIHCLWKPEQGVASVHLLVMHASFILEWVKLNQFPINYNNLRII